MQADKTLEPRHPCFEENCLYEAQLICSNYCSKSFAFAIFWNIMGRRETEAGIT